MTKFCFRFQRPLPNSSSFQDDETETKPEANFSTGNWLARLFHLKDKIVWQLTVSSLLLSKVGGANWF